MEWELNERGTQSKAKGRRYQPSGFFPFAQNDFTQNNSVFNGKTLMVDCPVGKYGEEIDLKEAA